MEAPYKRAEHLIFYVNVARPKNGDTYSEKNAFFFLQCYTFLVIFISVLTFYI